MLDCPAPGARLDRKVKVSAALRLIRNAIYWTVDDDFFATPRHEQVERLRSKARLWRARARDRSRDGAPSPDVRDRLGLWQYPASSRESLEAHAQMIRSYRAERYSGRVTVLRARTTSFSLRTSSDLGWRALADDVRVRVVHGAHDTILKEPRVRGLAAALETELSTRAPV